MCDWPMEGKETRPPRQVSVIRQTRHRSVLGGGAIHTFRTCFFWGEGRGRGVITLQADPGFRIRQERGGGKGGWLVAL